MARRVARIALVRRRPRWSAAPGRRRRVRRSSPARAWSKPIGPTHLSSPVIADVNGDGHLDVVTADLSGVAARARRPQRPRAPGLAAARAAARGAAPPRWSRARPLPTSITTATSRSSSAPVRVDVAESARRRRRVQRERLGALPAADDDGRGPERRAGNAGSRRRERRRLPRRRVRQLRPSHLRAQPVRRRAPRLPDGQPRHDLGLARALRRRATSGAWTSSSAATRAPAVRAASQTWSGIMRAIRVDGGRARRCCGRAASTRSTSRARRSATSTARGRMALVVGTGTGPSGDAFATNSLSAFYLDNGATVPGWPVVLNGPIFGSPVIGDVNGDHKNDVVVTACATCNDGRVWAFNGHGGALWNRRLGGTTPRSCRRRSSSTSTATASTTSPSVRPARSTSCAAATADVSTSRSK